MSSVPGSRTRSFINSGAALVDGEIVTYDGVNGGATAALATTALSIAGVAQVSGTVRTGGRVEAVTGGVGRVRLEASLVPVAGNLIWLSATTAGRGTNVKPGTALLVGAIIDASSYAIDGRVLAVIMPGVASSLSPSGADWPLTQVRYFIVDEDNGSDANTGYIDAAPGTDISATAPSVAIATWAHLLTIVPTLGNGRHAEVIFRRRAGGAVYTGTAQAKIGVFGYTTFTIRGTDTNTTAGCTAWDNTAADRAFNGGQQVPGTNAAGYAMAYSSVAVTGATAASPIQITTGAAHGFATGDRVYLQGVQGVYEANGGWLITVTGATTFTLDGSIGTGAWIAGGTQTVQRWKITTAAGGAPGFTDDATDKSLLGKRVRFDGATTTAGLRNLGVGIWSNGVDTIIPDLSPNAFGVPVGTDRFYIEEPGVAFDALAVTCRNQIDAFNLLTPPPSNDTQFAVQGFRVTGQLTLFSSDLIRVSFADVGGLTGSQIGTLGYLPNARFWAGDGVSVTFVIVGPNRIGNATNPDLISQIESIAQLLMNQTAHISTTLAFVMARVHMIAGTPGCGFSNGIEMTASGLGAGTTSSGTVHSAAVMLGNSESTLYRLTRIMGAGPINAGVFVHKTNLLIRGVEVSGVGVSAAILPFGNGGFITVRQLYGSGGNSAYGIDLAAAPAGNFANSSRNWFITLVQTNACAIRGTLGGLRLSGRTSIPMAYTDFYTHNIAQLEDGFGNKIQVVSTAPGATGGGAAQVGPLTDYTNGTGGAVAAYRLVRASTAAAKTALLAQADSAANATAVLGATINAPGTGLGFLVTRTKECWVEFDRSGAHPAPALGDQAYVSVDTAGLAQADVPATAATNQRLEVGHVVAIHPGDSDVGLLSMNVAPAPVLA